MTRFRRWLNRKGEGSIKDLAKKTGVTHAQISRIADGHRGASLKLALDLSSATGLPPSAFAKVNTQKGKSAPRSRTRERV